MYTAILTFQKYVLLDTYCTSKWCAVDRITQFCKTESCGTFFFTNLTYVQGIYIVVLLVFKNIFEILQNGVLVGVYFFVLLTRYMEASSW